MNIKCIFISICFLIVFLIDSCIAKRITGVNYTSGSISKISNTDEIYRFAYKIDSIDNFHIKIYSTTGFKIFDGIIKRDSLQTNYIIDESFKSIIDSYFSKYSSRVCINRIFIDLLRGFNDKNCLCYNVIKDSSAVNMSYTLLTRDYSKIFKVDYVDFKTLDHDRSLPKTMLVYFENGDTFKIEIKY